MTQGNIILNFLERVFRSNIYLFLISRFLIGRYFSKLIYDSDFKIIEILERKQFFYSKKLILDIGANDGMSYNIIRKFAKRAKIISFEPNNYNFKNLKKIEKIDKLFKCKNIALSNYNQKNHFFTPYFKKYAITQMAGINKSGVKKRLKNSLFFKRIFKIIYLKKEILKTKKLDYFKYNPCFIKIDIEGHELECIKGALGTIKKFNPILMVEYDKKICDKIYYILKKYKYNKFIYNKFEKKIEKFNNQKVFNIFFIHKNYLSYI